ncbi:MAG TPA: hypothetical protein VGG96_01550 [Steroidobacteraceae bacterium]
MRRARLGVRWGGVLGQSVELRVITNPIAEPGPARQLLSNLFYGCGYNFYHLAGELCADDMVIRGKLSQLLRECRVHLSSLEVAFRRQHRVADRDYAFLSPQAVTTSQSLLGAQRDLQAMETAIRTATVPERNRFHQRHREDRCTLKSLVALDGDVLLALVTLRDAVARFKDGPAAAASMDRLLRASDFAALWARREALLSGDSG